MEDTIVPRDPLLGSTLVLLCAFRYALGRSTYVVRAIAETLIAHRDRLSAADRALVVREIREHLASEFNGSADDLDTWEHVATVLDDDKETP